MGCPCEIYIEDQTQQDPLTVVHRVQNEVDRLDRKYSHYRNDSLLANIAALAGTGELFTVDEETANLLDFAAELYRESNGLFDITAGALTHQWDLQSDKLPSKEQIADARRQVGWQHVEWRRPALHLAIAGMTLDLGGIVKEYAADRAAQLCRDAGVYHGVIDLGGDLSLIGAHSNGQPWRVGIKSPSNRQQAIAYIDLPNGGLATSGDYERAMVIDGRRYSHIIDPIKGYPVESFASVSVVADSCLVAGAASTIAMLRGTEHGLQWLIELGLPYLCVYADGTTIGTLTSR